MKRKIIYLVIGLHLILLFLNYNILLPTCINAINIWLYKVFPYLFTMFILNDILISLGINNLLKNASIYIFITSLISGSPSSAFIIGNLYQNKIINYNTANNSLLFSFFINSLFLYNILNTLFDNYIAIKLMIIHYISNIIIYFIYKKNINNNYIINNNNAISITNSINKSMNTLIMILGTIIFFMIITNIINNTFHFNIIIDSIIKGFLEITQGLNTLNNITNNKIKEILAISFISFGGLSINMQVKSILDEYKLDYNYFLKGRILQVIIALLLTILT